MSDERGLTDSGTNAQGFRILSRKSEPPRSDYNNQVTTHKVKLHTIEQFELDVWDVLQEAGNLLLSKHADYGPTNIANAPGGALNGLRVRMWDKIARINNLLDNGVNPSNESLRDSFLDLMNYCAIAQMVIDKTWPELPND